MRLEVCIKNYFLKIPVKKWDYESFSEFMKVLGYDIDERIFRNYIRGLKEVLKSQVEEYKKDIAIKILHEFEKDVSNSNIFTI